MPRCRFIDRSNKCHSTAVLGMFQTHFRIWAVLIVEDPTVTIKCRTAIKILFLYFNLCLSVKFDSLSCSFTSILFLTNLYVSSNKHYCLHVLGLHFRGTSLHPMEGQQLSKYWWLSNSMVSPLQTCYIYLQRN